MSKRLGISITRGEAALVVLQAAGGAVLFEHFIPRTSEMPVEKILGDLLSILPDEWKSSDVVLALSPGDLGCGDIHDLPSSAEGQLEAIAPSLAESHCAGETAEQLAIDAAIMQRQGKTCRIELLSVEQRKLHALRETIKKHLPKAGLIAVTSVLSCLSRVLPADKARKAFVFHFSVEALAICKDQAQTAWRCMPVKANTPDAKLNEIARGLDSSITDAEIILVHPESEFSLTNSTRVEGRFAGAAAAALLNPESAANLLRGAPDAPKRLGDKLRGSLLLLASAAAIFLLSVGMYFNRKDSYAKANLEDCIVVEQKLWQQYLPGQTFKPDQLNARMKKALAERLKSEDANKIPSALALWSQVGTALPNPDGIGLTLESMQFDSSGGRIVGKVSAPQKEPLSNASALESALNGADDLIAHGEFENKGTEVIVRMRVDYQPRETKAEVRKP